MKPDSTLTCVLILILLAVGCSVVPVRVVAATAVDRYVVSTIGGATCLVDLATNITVACSSDVKGILQMAMGQLTASRTWQEKVTVKGDYMIDNSAGPLVVPSYTILELQGSVKAQAYDRTLIVVTGVYVSLIGGVYSGNRGQHIDSADTAVRVIQLSDASHALVQGVKIIDGYGRGLEVDDGQDNLILNVQAENCWRNYMFWSTNPSLPRNHRAEGLTSRYAQGGSGIDFGTIGYITISEITSQEDNPVAVSIDSANHITVKNVKSLYRGFALIYAGYTNTQEITIENAQSLGSGAGGFAAETRSRWNITDLTLANDTVTDPKDDALAFLRTSGQGTINHVHINDLYVGWTGTAKCNIRAALGVRDIGYSSAPGGNDRFRVFRRIDPSSSEVCDKTAMSYSKSTAASTSGSSPMIYASPMNLYVASVALYASTSTSFGASSLGITRETEFLAPQPRRYEPGL